MQTSANPSNAQILIDEKIRQLKAQRNLLSPVSKIPPEVLGQIFTRVTEYTMASHLKPTIRFNFSFVSQHWRNVAISTPQIWTVLSEDYLTWSRVMLERSKTADLVVHVDIQRGYGRSEYSISRKSEFLQHVFEKHASRIVHLSVESNRDIPNFPPLTPRLQILYLSFEGSRTDPLHFPTYLLSASPLVELRVEGYKVDWKLFSFPALKTLILMFVRSEPSSALDFIKALQRTPQLERLRIFHSLPVSFDRAELSTIPPVELLALQELHISDTSSASLIPCLKIPASVSVALS
ncbi:hypothetical protein CPB83DRAFT_911417 [Crepidotus variabilis]|uniref:F-box domain-containing protein n=1 Tax=Crepidotus variabilis TaxID=179855 RepID=A0A9P6E4K6_9AGAR|nr:hypothetical protein CPB83DRAFT_911417 [Crepidotus variabilis]